MISLLREAFTVSNSDYLLYRLQPRNGLARACFTSLVLSIYH
jgi:hypothetical protein